MLARRSTSVNILKTTECTLQNGDVHVRELCVNGDFKILLKAMVAQKKE